MQLVMEEKKEDLSEQMITFLHCRAIEIYLDGEYLENKKSHIITP